jgi:hypothetical protein
MHGGFKPATMGSNSAVCKKQANKQMKTVPKTRKIPK